MFPILIFLFCVLNRILPDEIPISLSPQRAGAGAALSMVPLRVAWCVPSTCRAKDVQELASLMILGTGLPMRVAVSENSCTTERHSSLNPKDIFAICFLAFFIILAILSTTYDVLTLEKESRRELLLAFSIYTNGRKLVAVSHKGDQIWCLHGIRSLSLCWVILCHRYSKVLGYPTINNIDLLDFFTSYWRLPITNGTLSVDTFFIMSGLLLSFLFLKEVTRSGRFDVFKFYIHRYLRLTPVVGVMILLSVTLFQYGGWGPMWKETMEFYQTTCEKNWWVTLLYVNNYVHIKEMCVGHTWYLSVDMQLYWLSPLVLIPLWKFRKFAKVWISFLLLAGFAIPFAIIYIEEILDAPSIKYYAQRWRNGSKYYMPAYTRYTPWLLGIVLGVILRSERKVKTKLSPVVVLCGWVVSMGLIVGSVSSAYPFGQLDYEYSRVEAAFFGSLYRTMFSLGVCWIIFACDQGYGGIVNTILSWGFFQPFSRLSYGMYLTHLLWISFSLAFIRSPIYFSDITLIPLFFGDILMSLAWTIPLVLLFEAPILVLEKAAFGYVKNPATPGFHTLGMEGGRKGKESN